MEFRIVGLQWKSVRRLLDRHQEFRDGRRGDVAGGDVHDSMEGTALMEPQRDPIPFLPETEFHLAAVTPRIVHRPDLDRRQLLQTPFPLQHLLEGVQLPFHLRRVGHLLEIAPAAGPKMLAPGLDPIRRRGFDLQDLGFDLIRPHPDQLDLDQISGNSLFDEDRLALKVAKCPAVGSQILDLEGDNFSNLDLWTRLWMNAIGSYWPAALDEALSPIVITWAVRLPDATS